MVNILDLRKKYSKLEETISKANEEKKEILKTLQENCSHKFVLEKDYSPETNFSYAGPPARVCEVCNYSEEGWGAGYKKLKDSPERIIQKVDRDDFHKDQIIHTIHNLDYFLKK